MKRAHASTRTKRKPVKESLSGRRRPPSPPSANHVPCITLNSYTEHIETVKVGTNELVGEDAQLLGQKVAQMVSGQWKQGELPDRWDGRTAERILQILSEE